jgi:molybdopterin molybdotransferase
MRQGAASPREERETVRHGMRPVETLISFDKALRIAMDAIRPIRRAEQVSLLEGLGRVAAKDVRSKIDVPPADRAAMDGYAVVARDTAGAGPSSPATLRRIETLHAESVPQRRVTPGVCAEIATGSMLPRGADAVVRVEDTDRRGDSVRIFVAVRPGRNVSARGADIRRGSVVVHEGEEMSPAKVGALAAVGQTGVQAYARPRVSILVTGDEIVPPGSEIHPGQVYDINSYALASIVRKNGGDPVLLGHVSDRARAVRSALRRGLRNDFVVVSGGSSAGERDLVVDVVRSTGEVLFHGIAVKPGKPTALGRVGGKPVLVMPGNPTSCLSNGYVILAPMLRRMARLPAAARRTIDVPLAGTMERAPGRLEFHTVRIVDGKAISAFKESSAITSMALADGYIEVPADVERIKAGQPVRVVLF